MYKIRDKQPDSKTSVIINNSMVLLQCFIATSAKRKDAKLRPTTNICPVNLIVPETSIFVRLVETFVSVHLGYFQKNLPLHSQVMKTINCCLGWQYTRHFDRIYTVTHGERCESLETPGKATWTCRCRSRIYGPMPVRHCEGVQH